MNIEEMIQRQQELLNKAKAEKRELTTEEQREFDELQRAINLAKPTGNSSEPTVTNDNMAAERAKEAERGRILEITSLCRDFDVSNEDLQRYIENNATVANVREAILKKMKDEKKPVPQEGHAYMTDSEEDKYRRAAADALVMRSGIALDKPEDGAREMMHMSLRDLAIESLSKDGVTGLNRRSSDDLFQMVSRQFFNPTAAFPAILDNAINKAYVEGHKKVATTFEAWTDKGTLKDFKTHDNNYLAGPVGEFLEVPEGGEIKHDTHKDVKLPTRKLKTYGRQFTLTREAFINDDIDLITKMPARYAASAKKTINKQCYEILVKNPVIYDGTPLFNKAHGNLVTTGTGVTQASLQAMIMALQTQLDQYGEAIIIRPAVIVVPVGLSFDIYTLFNSPTINTEGNTQAVNPLYKYKDHIVVVEDPTINVLCGGFGNVMPWWLIGSKDDTAFMQVDYLNGKEIPTIRRSEVTGRLGFVWDIYLDWGINVMDYRGAIKNPGVKIENPLG